MHVRHFIRFTILYATKLILSMRRRLFLVFLSPLTVSISFANNEASWSCHQDKNSNEWVCIGAQNVLDKNREAIALTPTEKGKDSAQSEVFEKDKNTAPATAQPGQSSPPTSPEQSLLPESRPSVIRDDKAEGQEQLVDGPQEFNISLLNPVFDHKQEQIFGVLTSQFKSDPWENCTVPEDIPENVITGGDRNVSPLDVKSNYSEIFDNEIGSYFGNVEMRRADQHAQSDTANYDSVSETLNLQGNVYYSEEELALHSDTATLKLASDQARLRNTLFISAATPLRGRAKAVYRDSKYLSRYKDVAYTTCRPGNQDWAVHASELKLNKITGKGAAKNAWVEFKGVPVFYSPYLSFPVDNRRLSGFLAPAYHYTQISGLNLSVPYYWNIAPNYDATLSPRYYTRRGAMLAGNFRYLTERSKGIANVEYLPYDSLLNKARYLGSLKNTTQFTPKINSNLDLNYVSDKNYFAELGNALSFPNFSFVRSSADIGYASEGVSFISRVESYQTIDPALRDIQIPYKRLPQINLNLNHSFNFMPLDAAMESESVYFQHNDLVNGQRLNIKPSVSFPLQTASTYLTPKISLQHTQYFLNNQVSERPGDISRTLPIVSVDSGVYLERDLNIARSTLLHTIEPRLFYLYIPKTDQSNIPLFDTSLYDFWYSSLFRENRFSGTDRIQDANQISVAVTSRLVDPATGRERLKLNLGEIFYFRDREVTLDLPFSPVETSNSSPLVAELSSELTDHFSVESGLQWDPHLNDIVRGKAALHFINQPDQIINVGYLYRKNPLVPDRSNDIIQSDMSFRWPIYNNWYAVGRWQYSLLYNITQDSFFGLEKENCCWRFRVIGRRYINSIINVNSISQAASINNSNLAVDGTLQTGIFFQVELKGLTGIGEKLDDFFEQSIYGYRKPKK
jgi:LPS-assembly protein